ncbi:MAG: RNA-binding S4 domain-containing protein [Acidaminococcaceae bacterium]|nr:RNA-binding S4 domain-containing protein [Acidaminococcaceae bacterium]
MEQETVAVKNGEITLDKLLKFSGIAATGGQAFFLIEEGAVSVNGEKIHQKRKKVKAGDRVVVDEQVELLVVSEE